MEKTKKIVIKIKGIKINYSPVFNTSSGLINFLNFNKKVIPIEEVAFDQKNKNKITSFFEKTVEKDQNNSIRSLLSENPFIFRSFQFLSPDDSIQLPKFKLDLKIKATENLTLFWGIKIHRLDELIMKTYEGDSFPIYTTPGDKQIPENVFLVKLEWLGFYEINAKLDSFQKSDSFHLLINRDGSCLIGFLLDIKAKIDFETSFNYYFNFSDRYNPITDKFITFVSSKDWKNSLYSCVGLWLNEDWKSMVGYKSSDFEYSPIITSSYDLYIINDIINSTQIRNIIDLRSSNDFTGITLQEEISIINIDPRHKWKDLYNKFSFLIILPDDHIYASIFLHWIKHLRCYPIISNHINSVDLTTIKDSLLSNKVIISPFLSNDDKIVLKNNNFSLIEFGSSNLEKTSILCFEILEIIFFLSKVSRIFKKKILSNLEEILISSISNDLRSIINTFLEIKELPIIINRLKNSKLRVKFKELRNFFIILSTVHVSTIGCPIRHHFFPLESRFTIISENLDSENLISIYQYSLAFNSPLLVLKESNIPKSAEKITKKIIEFMDGRAIPEELIMKLYNLNSSSVIPKFLIEWVNIGNNIDIFRKLSHKHNLKDYSNLFSKKDRTGNIGSISLFTKRNILYEYGIVPEGRENFVFGRFLVNSKRALISQITSALIFQNRKKEFGRKFGSITAETDKNLINYTKKLRQLIQCFGDVVEGVGGFSSSKIIDIFANTDLVFMFAHGNKDSINLLNQKLSSMSLDSKFQLNTILVLNSCETGLNFTGNDEDLITFLVCFGMPNVIAPLTKIRKDYSLNLAISMSTKILDGVPFGLELHNSKEFYRKLGKPRIHPYLLFGCPYIYLGPDYKINRSKSTKCQEDILKKENIEKVIV